MRIIGKDKVGTVAVTDEGWPFYLTPCCEAAATGSVDGVACKACWHLVDDALGGVPVITELED